jgi:hypothetical protein
MYLQLTGKQGVIKNAFDQSGNIEMHTYNHRVRQLRLISYPTVVSYEDFSKKRDDFLNYEFKGA